MTTILHRILPIFLIAVLTSGDKCVPYDAALDPASEDYAVPQAASTGCGVEGQARLRVENFAYQIQCGCQESSGTTCTVPAGTTVIWEFADSTAHNVTSVANAFGVSANEIAGLFEVEFERAGTFEYGCSIHPFDMSGYSIVVE